MVKKLLLASAILCIPSHALAQTFPKPPDVSAYVPIAPIYKTDGTANTVIDSTVTPMPVTPLTNIPTPSSVNRIVSIGPFDGSASPFCTTIPYGGTCHENKMRTVVDYSHMLPDDPIRNYGQPGQSHLHCFFGSGSTNARSTYKSLRQHGLNSTAAGTDENATGYWHPCFVVLDPYGNGKNYAIRPNFYIVYYNENPASDGTGANAKAHIPTGKRYVFGFDMDAASVATQYAWLQSVLTTANAAQGYNRYQLTHPTTGRMNTQATYNCAAATPPQVTVLKNADGTDPHGGTCASGANFYLAISGPSCYDGNNLWADGGYKNLIPSVWDTVVSKFVCPTNYYRVANLTLEVNLTQYGWADRERWDLSSDIAYRAAKGLTQATLPPGTTFHTDWQDGWNDITRKEWEDNCLGVEHAIGHECNSSQINNTDYLKGGYAGETGAGGRNPQVDTSVIAHVLETDPGWILIPPAWTGSLTNFHVH